MWLICSFSNRRSKMNLLFLLVYVLIGFALAVPYVFLAGWDRENLVYIGMFLPIASLILFLIHVLSKKAWNPDLPKDGLRKIFWVFLGYCLLPILLNGVSFAFTLVGMEAVGDFIFKYRFLSLWMVPSVAIAGLIIYCIVCAIFQRKHVDGTGTPP